MKTKPQHLYVHQITGSMVSVTKSDAKKLPKDYKKVEFVKNDKGTQVARMRIDGGITIDIAERETLEVTHVKHNAE